MMENKLLDTPFHKKVIPSLITLLEHTGATYGAIVAVMTNELRNIYPVDVQLLLEWMVRDEYLNVEDGIYCLNHTEENDKLFKECLDYYPHQLPFFKRL